jgi:hypothetical protein
MADIEDDKNAEISSKVRFLEREAVHLQVKYAALMPEQRAIVDAQLREHAPEFEFVAEVVQRITNGLMSTQEADHLLDELSRQLDDRRKRKNKPEAPGHDEG